MRSQHPLQDRWLELLDSLRLRLSGVDALPQLALLGLLSGGLAGGVTIAFRLLIESVQAGLLPGGLIGPSLIIGSTAGGVMGLVAQLWFPGNIASPGFYAPIGMGTMMGATLQAPLAALTAMLELTANPNIILPGMLALITAGLVSKEVFGKDSVFLHLIRAHGLDYRNDPVMQALRRTGVGHTMDRSVMVFGQQVERNEITQALQGQPRWVLVKEDNRGVALLPAADLVRHLQENQEQASVDLLAIPAQRLALAPIHIQATLQ